MELVWGKKYGYGDEVGWKIYGFLAEKWWFGLSFKIKVDSVLDWDFTAYANRQRRNP